MLLNCQAARFVKGFLQSANQLLAFLVTSWLSSGLMVKNKMPKNPLFAGLVIDEQDRPVETALVGGEPFYVVDDLGFHRHIPSEQVDRQVLAQMQEMMKGNEGLISEQTAKMLGQEDIFTKAMLEQQLKNIDKQFDQLMQAGIPEEGRAYLGMLGFKVVINHHGEVVKVEQPSAPPSDEGGGES